MISAHAKFQWFRFSFQVRKKHAAAIELALFFFSSKITLPPPASLMIYTLQKGHLKWQYFLHFLFLFTWLKSMGWQYVIISLRFSLMHIIILCLGAPCATTVPFDARATPRQNTGHHYRNAAARNGNAHKKPQLRMYGQIILIITASILRYWFW